MTSILPYKDACRDPAFWIATWFGSGLIPFAPGTWGTLAALPFGWGLYSAGGALALLLGACAALVAGVWASNRYMVQTGRHDPGAVVIDEVAGVWITLAALPVDAAWYFWAIAFVLFRFFDILKPWPIRSLDRNVGGGWGVMLDDIVAGLFGAVVLWGIAHVL